MAREHFRIYLSIWDDPDFLNLTESQQRLYFALGSSKDLSYCGVHPLLPRRLRTASDLTERKILAAIAALTEARFTVLDRETDELCLRTYIKWDGILKQPNLVRAMNKAYARVHSALLQEVITEELGKALADTFTEGIPPGIAKALSEGFGKGFAEGSREGSSHSPSPFPLPPSKPNRPVANASSGMAQLGDVLGLVVNR